MENTATNLQTPFITPGGEVFELDLHGAQIPSARFPNSYLVNADFRQANLSNSDFSNALLTNANFAGADLQGANFSGADLTNACLNGTNLDLAVFSGAKLVDTDFSSTKMRGTDLRGADLSRSQGLHGYNLLEVKSDDKTLVSEEVLKEAQDYAERRNKAYEEAGGLADSGNSSGQFDHDEGQ